jgi:Zn-finger nucleic acid-binding protein
MQKITNDARQPDARANGKYQFKTEPWAHQREALKQSWDKKYFALLMEYGTGKTKVIIDNAGILFERGEIDALFIIAPNGVHEQWITEQLPMHMPERIKYIARVWTGANTKKFKRGLQEFWQEKSAHKLKIFTANVEAFQMSPRAQAFGKNFLNSFNTMLVVDESTRIKTPGAKRTKFIIGQLARLAVYRRTLTGNEVTRSPFDVYSPYRFLNQNFWEPIRNYHLFCHRYGKFKTNYIYRKQIKVDMGCPKCKKHINEILFKRQGRLFAICPRCRAVLNDERLPAKVDKLIDNEGRFEYPTLIKYRRLDELREKTAAVSYLVRKDDCLDLPPKIYDPIYAELNADQKRLYQELKTERVTEYQGAELSVANKLALSVRFQQIVGGFFPETEEPIGSNNPKIDRLLYDLEDIDCADPIIIWARFTAEIKAIAKALQANYDDRVITYFGETSKTERAEIRRDFDAGKIGFFVANTATAGTGLNLQRSYIHYYFSNSFNSEDRWQSEDRSHRGGQTRACLYKDIFIKGTVDDTIKKSNDEKKHIAEFFKARPLEELV